MKNPYVQINTMFPRSIYFAQLLSLRSKTFDQSFDCGSPPSFEKTSVIIFLLLINSPEQNAERRINKGKVGLEVFLYHYKGIETANRMSYN